MLTALAKAQAFEAGRAVPVATRRHVHLADRPLVFVPLQLAGEANAPLACLIGTDRQHPTMLVVPQPRNRDLRFAFAARLAEGVLAYVDSHTVSLVPDGSRATFADAPQVVVPNPGGVEFTRLLGRSTRLRRTDGEYAVAPGVPLLGRWLTWLTDQTERPGSSVMLPVTTVLTQHWATGQSALEDANLAALMGWIAPWRGLTGPQAAAEAEDPTRWPPAGPATDPDFDNEVLAVLIRRYDDAADDAADEDGRQRATAAIGQALRSQLEPTWRLVWQALDLLRALPEASSVPDRWLADRRAFTRIVEYWRDGGFPQARVDGAVRAAQRLDRMEKDLDAYTAQRAFDDELAMAELRLTGEAFAGPVVSVDADRVDASGRRRVPRPLVTLGTADPVRLEVGAEVRSPARPGQRARIVDIAWTPRVLVTLELVSGMGRGVRPAEGSVPAVGEWLCYSVLAANPAVPARFPSREETPWTHGGPPRPYEADDDGGAAASIEDAAEDWS